MEVDQIETFLAIAQLGSFTRAGTRVHRSQPAIWYEAFLDLPMSGPSALFSAFFVDDILFFFEQVGTSDDYHATDTQVLGHMAFAVSNLDAWLYRATAQNIEIVAQPAEAHGFRSFFVRGPDGLLIELVEARKSAELCDSGTSVRPASPRR